MQVKMLCGLANPDFSVNAGDIYDCDDAEGIRLIEAGAAVPYANAPIERAVKRRAAAETRAAPEVVAEPVTEVVEDAPAVVETPE